MLSNDAGIVTFDHPRLGDAADELRALGLESATAFFEHLGDIQAGKLDPSWLKVFYEYGGVEFFHAQIGSAIMVYAVEPVGHGDVKITIMFAGEFGKPAGIPPWFWDGYDYAALVSRIIGPRASVWFL